MCNKVELLTRPRSLALVWQHSTNNTSSITRVYIETQQVLPIVNKEKLYIRSTLLLIMDVEYDIYLKLHCAS